MNVNESSLKSRTLDTRYGSLTVPSDATDLITNFLEHYGEWSFLEVEYLAALMPAGARVLDVGAYLGTFSIGLAKLANPSFIGMVEGNAASAPFLAANAADNIRCAHEVMHALVVDPGAPPIKGGWADADNVGSTSFVPGATGQIRVGVPQVQIGFQELVRRFMPLDLVKLDVEGMEETLLSSDPDLLRDASVLFWLECNESPASVSLARMLLETGRPLTYFAWPSHNPDNYLGASRSIFPFAYEAGLLLGAAPLALTPRQVRAGCMVEPITRPEDLEEALWRTPRWAPGEWEALGPHQIAGIAGHLASGKKREDFLASSCMNAGHGNARSISDVRHQLALRNARIARLESKLAELSSQYQEAQRDLARQVLQHTQGPYPAEGGIAGPRASGSQGMFDDAAALRQTLHSMQSSITWRAALRVSRIADRIPYLKRALRFALRKKQAWAVR